MAIKKPPIRRPLPPVQPQELPGEELPPIEPIEELPPVEPVVLEPAELYPLIARLYPSFPTLKPEELPTKMVKLGSLAQEDPEAFLYDLDFRATPEERDIVLRALGVSEEYFVAREVAIEEVEAEEARITELVTTVFPDIETPEELIDFATDQWDLFMLSIQEKGRSKETQDLLRLMGFEWEDIGKIFAEEKVFMDVDGVRTLVTVDVNERGIPLVKDTRGRTIGEVDPITNEVIPYQYRIGDTWEHFTAGVGDVIVTAGGALKWLGKDEMGENLSEFGQFLQLQAPPDTLGEFEWSHLLNPRFYATRVARTLPFSLSLIPAAIGGAYAGAWVAGAIGLGKFGITVLGHTITAKFAVGALSAGVASRTIESALEAGGTYDEAIAKGLSEAEAREAASSVFFNNLKLAGVDATQFLVAFAPISGRVFTNLITRGLVKTAMVGGRLTITALSEAGEEIYQEIIQRVALGEDVVWDAEMKEVAAIGGIMGIGLGSAGSVWTSIKNKVIDSMTPEMKAKFDTDKAGFVGQGFDEKQAELKALDEFAETEEATNLIENATDIENIDAFEKEIKPKTEADKIVWEQTFDKMREEITPIEVPVVPEVPLTEALITEGESIVVKAEAIAPTNTSVIEFRRLVEQAKVATTPEAQRQALTQMEALEDEVRAIAKVPKPPAVEVAKPPVEIEPVIPPTEPIAQGIITETQGMRDLGIKEVVRPARKVLTRIGKWRELFKPTQRAEVEFHEEQRAKTKMFDSWQKLLGKDKARWALVSDEINEKGSVVGLTFDEKRVVAQYRKWADEWADRKDLAQERRVKDYMPHLFEQEAARQVKEEGGIDPVLAQMLSEKVTRKIADPFLKKRLGAVGWIKDPVSAARAYEAVSLKFAYYTPMLNKIDAILADPSVPQTVKNYLSGYSKRMTGELSDIDKRGNITIREFAEKIRGVPKIGEWFYTRMTQGNPMGMASYHLTGGLYMLFLGYKATSAIRNLSQHTLILGEVGPKHFANAIRLRLTAEGRATLKKSIVLRSRKFAYTAGLDSSYINRWTDKFREATLYMFRLADRQNVSDAFLAGYSEAKELYSEADEQVWIDRGDEVAADTQYLYTKMNSMSFAQNAPGRTMSMLTTWTENWIELMTKWIKRTPSQVYLEQERLTGKAMPVKNWSQTYKAITLYMTLVGLAFAFEDDTRLKIKEYTGVGSLRYLAGAVGGEFPALEAVGSMADMITGFLLNDERQMKAGFAEFKSTFTPGIIRQLNNVGSGEKDWMTLFFYMEGKDFQIKNLKDKWRKDWKEYEDLPTGKPKNQWRVDNPLEEAKMFVIGRFTTLSSDKARSEVLRLIEEHELDTELIDGYEKIFGIDTQAELKSFENRLGELEALVVGEEAKYFTMGNYVSEVNALVKSVGRAKVQGEASPLTLGILEARDTLEAYENLEEGDARTLWRQQFPEAEAWMYLMGKVSSFKNPKSAEILLGLMKKYNIPPEAIRAFIDDPTRYDELFTQKFELEQKWFDQTTEYENFGNTEAPNYIEDKEERKLAREKFKEDNPDWVADMRRIEAIDNDASDIIIERWVERGKTIDEFGAGSSQAKVWLLDNPDTHKWALDNKLLSDDGSDWNEDILRINVQLEGLDKESDEYKKLNYKKNALQVEFPEEQVDNYIDWYMAKRKDYEDDWFLQENPEFYQAMLDKEILQERDFSKVPTREVYAKYQGYLKEQPVKPDNYEDINKTDLWYEDDWYFIEHPDIYKEVYLGFLGNQPKDFSTVPTREIFDKYLIYLKKVPGKPRMDYRWENIDLDAWGVLKFGWVSIVEQKRRAELTPTEEFLEGVAKKEAEFDEDMRELEELLKGLK